MSAKKHDGFRNAHSDNRIPADYIHEKKAEGVDGKWTMATVVAQIYDDGGRKPWRRKLVDVTTMHARASALSAFWLGKSDARLPHKGTRAQSVTDTRVEREEAFEPDKS